MTGPASAAVRDRARDLVRAELAVRLSHGHDAILRRTADQYRKIVGEALAADPATGKAGQVRAAQRALDRIAHLGVVDFVDQSGRRWNMQSYVEMAVRTAALRARTKAHMDVLRERGVQLVYVTNHAGQCPLCRPFESKLLAIDELPDGPIDGPEVVATVEQAIAAGLFHPNCKHATKAWRPGTVIPEAVPDPEGYVDEQKLRYLERGVRQWKTREAAALTDDARAKARAKVEEWQAGIRRHVAETGAGRVRGREQIDRALTAPATRRTVAAAPARPDDLPARRTAIEREAARIADEVARNRTDDEVAADELHDFFAGDGLTYRPPTEEGERSPDHEAFLDQFSDESRPQDQGASGQVVRVVTDPATGRRLVYKRAQYGEVDEIEAEVLGSLIGRAVGANVPKVWRLDDDAVAMEFIPGRTTPSEFLHQGLDEEAQQAWWRRPEGDRLAVMDFIAENRDRNPGNVMVGDDGQLYGIDHSNLLTAYDRYNLTPPPEADRVRSEFGNRPWERAGITVEMLDEIGPRLAALREEFDRVGGDAPGRHARMMERFAMLRGQLAVRGARRSAR